MTRHLRAACLVLWAAAAIGAALAGADVRVLAVDAPHDALSATAATAGGLFVHNALVVLWPLTLVTLGWPRLGAARRAGDALIGGQLVTHGLLVGNALGQHPETWRYLPHLPLEWLALVLPASAWTHARRGAPPSTYQVGRLAVATLALLALAATIETYLVPLP
jgi:hypothetical protein